MRSRIIKVPAVRYDRAKQIQARYRSDGLNVPLWACLNEPTNKKEDDAKRFFRRIL